MAKIRISRWPDKRSASAEAPLYLVLRHKNRRATLALPVLVTERQWNAQAMVVRKAHIHHRRLNAYLRQILTEADTVVTTIIREPISTG